MSARNELLGYMATTIGTIAVLFGLQHWYASYLDVFVVHGSLDQTPMNETLQKVRAEEAQKLSGLDKAMQSLAAGVRPAAVSPQPSDDLSPMSGWVRRKGFAPYNPKPYVLAAAPAAAVPTAAVPMEAGAPATGEGAEQAQQPAATQGAEAPPPQARPVQAPPAARIVGGGRIGAMPARERSPER